MKHSSPNNFYGLEIRELLLVRRLVGSSGSNSCSVDDGKEASSIDDYIIEASNIFLLS